MAQREQIHTQDNGSTCFYDFRICFNANNRFLHYIHNENQYLSATILREDENMQTGKRVRRRKIKRKIIQRK